MDDKKIKVAITHGDANGVGYELIFKTFNEPDMLQLCTPVIYGSPKLAAYHRNALEMQANFSIIKDADEAIDGRINMLTTFDEDVKVELGTPTKESGEAAIKAIDRAIEDYRQQKFEVLVTAPMTMQHVNTDGKLFHTQSEYIANRIDNQVKPLYIMTNRGLRIASVTNKMPISEAAKTITTEAIVEQTNTFITALKRDFRVSAPRIAVLSLNPYKGENSSVGKEENEIIKPAIEIINQKSPVAFGPYNPETFFANRQYEMFDGIMAMYHEQAVLPFSLISSEQPVCLTAGLPVVHTYTNDDCLFQHAGKGDADEKAIRDAIYLAIDIIRNREDYDRPFDNPLPKLYHEKKDEGDRPRFAVKKNEEQANSEE